MTMTQSEVIELLESVGAIANGHFALSSGRHSDVYVEKFRALERPDIALRLGTELANRFSEKGIDVVLAPAVGGIVLGFVTASALGVRSIFAERVDGMMTLRRGFEIEPNEKVLVLEDVITTGASLREVIDLVPKTQLAGIGCLVDRSGGIQLPLPLESLASLPVASWDRSECSLCAQAEPIVAPGSKHLVNP